MAPKASQAGYNLVILMVAVTVMNIAVAAALPMWSTYMKRQKEAELVFRGLQYAEGIRVFQQRFGRPPLRLAELVEVEPRSMRRLWEDPMTGSADWGLVIPFGVPLPEAPLEPGSGRPGESPPGAGRAPTTGDPSPESGTQGDPSRPGAARGLILGVYSRSTEEGLRTFFGQRRYDQWHFTADLVTPGGGTPPGQPGARPAPPRPGAGGRPGQPPGTVPMTRLEWIGRPFPPGVEPQIPGLTPGSPPGDPAPGRPGRPQRPRGRG